MRCCNIFWSFFLIKIFITTTTKKTRQAKYISFDLRLNIHRCRSKGSEWHANKRRSFCRYNRINIVKENLLWSCTCVCNWCNGHRFSILYLLFATYYVICVYLHSLFSAFNVTTLCRFNVVSEWFVSKIICFFISFISFICKHYK